jgi:hypothetical protein
LGTPAIEAVPLSSDVTLNNTDSFRWARRPLLSWALRVVALLLPVVAGVAVSWWTTVLIPLPATTAARVEKLVLVLAASTGATFLVGRFAHRLLPLAALLRLSLAFPDRVPSRFAVSLRRTSVRQWSRRVSGGETIGGDTKVAAELVRLVRSLSEHHRPTRGHCERVRAYADMLGQQLGLSDSDRERLGWAALLHDIGKLTVPSHLLDKPGRPSDEEWAVISKHPLRGGGLHPAVREWLGEWWLGIVQHHERWDGTGYPFGLAGTEISLSARIIAVADSFETMTSARAYKRADNAQVARTELVRCAGGQFDPSIVRALLEVNVGSMQSVSRLAFLAGLPISTIVAQLGDAARASAAVATVAATTVLGPAAQTLARPVTAPVHASSASGERNPTRPEISAPRNRSTAATTAKARPGAVSAAGSAAASTTTSAPEPTASPPTTHPVGKTTTPTSGRPATTPVATVKLPPSTHATEPAAPAGADLVAVADAAHTGQGTPVEIDVLANDRRRPSTRVLSFPGHTAHGTVRAAGHRLVYRPAGSWTGTDSFTYKICAGEAAVSCSSAAVTVTVAFGPLHASPDLVVLNDSANGVVDPLANDTGDLDTSSVSVVAVEPGLLADVQGNGKIHVARDNRNPGAGRVVRYRVCDMAGACTEGAISVASH